MGSITQRDQWRILLKRTLTISAGFGLVALGIAFSGQAVVAQSAPSGDTLFRQRCSMCHSAVSTRQMPLGPNLAGVVGRKAAATTFNYSPAFKKSGLVWNRANLDRYLSAPARMIPGTKMVVSVPNAAERAALINYLATTR
jgi:cytochrome c